MLCDIHLANCDQLEAWDGIDEHVQLEELVQRIVMYRQ